MWPSARRAEQTGTGPAPRRLRSQGRSGGIGWPARFALAGPGRRIQFLYNTDLTAADYVKRKAWWDASAPACPYHPQGGCELVPHGTYGRKFPAGARVRRFRCPPAGRTVSLLPKCLAAHWSGELHEIERTAREAGRAKSRQEAANRLRQDYVELAGALR